ncbi:MAG: ribosome small subunit-dependent GTPase A [Bacteroidetes bacterium]|nr:ribosome small subunit-dependent GTPase A [Bacteroidota bacterium]
MTAAANSDAPSTVVGTVIRSTGSWYSVLPDSGEEIIQARARGKFRLLQKEIAETNPLAVGDRVSLRMEGDGSGLITEIHPRRNQLSRRAAGRKVGKEHVIAANVDAAWCVQSAFSPKFNAGFVDRFLVMAEAYHLDAGLVINKIDLLEDEPHAQDVIAFWKELYQNIGYPVLMTCAISGKGVDGLGDVLRDKTSVVAGPSGVGKTSLLNTLEPDLDLKTGVVSEKTQKGKHTTTFATLHQVAGGLVVDTPGIREFGIWDMAPEELGGYFVEFLPLIGHCRFPDCTHDHEPDCAVSKAVDEGAITPERYGSYLNILASLQEGRRDVGR